MKSSAIYRASVKDCLSPDHYLFQDVLAVVHNEPTIVQTITFMKAPHVDGRQRLESWSLKFSAADDGLFMGMSADPSQDLLVVVVYVGDPTAAAT